MCNVMNFLSYMHIFYSGVKIENVGLYLIDPIELTENATGHS